MHPLVGRLAPTAVVAALVAWCVWPYLNGEGSGGLVQEPGEVPEIASSLLDPTIEPAGDRNPFRAADADEPEAIEPATTEEEKPDVDAPPPPPEVQPGDVLKRLALDATFIHGGRSMALINGQVCEQGDALAISGLTTEPCIVTQITPHRVLIDFRGETLELKYRDSRAKPARSEPVDTSQQTEPVQPTEEGTVDSGTGES
jgi:hypothetical protein